MLQALAYGIDGWKCDGTDPYILELIVPLGKGGIVTRKQYSDAYYGDFFDYTRRKRGNETLIMSRPADGLEFMLVLQFSEYTHVSVQQLYILNTHFKFFLPLFPLLLVGY